MRVYRQFYPKSFISNSYFSEQHFVHLIGIWNPIVSFVSFPFLFSICLAFFVLSFSILFPHFPTFIFYCRSAIDLSFTDASRNFKNAKGNRISKKSLVWNIRMRANMTYLKPVTSDNSSVAIREIWRKRQMPFY